MNDPAGNRLVTVASWPTGSQRHRASSRPSEWSLIVRRVNRENAFCAGRIGSVEVLIAAASEGTFSATISRLVAGHADLR